jgi:general secretion pathway protein I
VHSKIHNRGYTLIEVLVAFMILALALTVLLRIFSGGLRNVSASSDYAHAALIAESQLAAAGLGGVLSPGVSHGEVDKRFQWTQTVSAYVPFPGYATSVKNIPAYYVSVTVEWPHGNGTRSIDIATVRLLRAKDRGS